MHTDYQLFAAINGFAGRWPWLDATGRFLVIYGLLVVLLLVLAVLWWPRYSSEERKRAVRATLLAGAGCLLLFAIEWVVVTHVLHHDMRSRPDNALWATLLVAVGSHYAFPAWPALIAMALAYPLRRFSRWGGGSALAIAALLTLALVFAGVNYPIDVVTGVLLGLGIGVTVDGFMHRAPAGHRRLVRPTTMLTWSVIGLWGIGIGQWLQPVGAEYPPPATPAAVSTTLVSPPPAVMPAFRAVVGNHELRVTAATNGHLTAGVVRLVFPSPDVSLAQVEHTATALVNISFAHWPSLDIVTVEIAANYSGSSRPLVGTLFTATVSRNQWPAQGFSFEQKLPGKRYYSYQIMAKQAKTSPAKVLSTGRR